MIRAGIIGATGYAGAELARLLLQRSDTVISWYGSHSYTGETFSSLYGNLRTFADVSCADDDLNKAAAVSDVLFTATPQGYCSSHLTADILEKCRVVDFSGDYRFRDPAVFEKWYGLKHETPELNREAVYGLPEINRERIRKARLIANPGCFPTCSFLSIYPVLKAGLIRPSSIIIDAKSGTSGAGRNGKVQNLFCEVNENMKAYGVTTHRHTPEIEEQLSAVAGSPVLVSFTPHLVPMMRGILVTAYADLTRKVSREEIRAAYDACYADEEFVRVLPDHRVPETRFVEGSNFADVGFEIDERTGRIVMMGAIDNLVKGAAGQAMQNMNLMFGLAEDCGLKQLPAFP